MLDDVRMVKRLRDLDFSLDLVHHVLLSELLFVQNFDSNFMPGQFVVSDYARVLMRKHGTLTFDLAEGPNTKVL